MTPVVLLPGMMCDARLFAPQVAMFGRQRAVHIAPIAARDNIAELARDVLSNAPQSFALVGLSMGGIVAMEVIAQAPDRVRGLALLDTNPLSEDAARHALRDQQIAEVGNGGPARVMREEMKPLYLANTKRRAEVLDLCLEMAMDLGADVFVHQSKALAGRPDQTKTLRSVEVPTLVLCGREDRLCPVERHELMRDLVPDAELCVIEQAGHLPVLEQPEATNAGLRSWLDRVDASIAATASS